MVNLKALQLAGGVTLDQKANKCIQPNVIVILTDDQGYGDLSCHGNPILQTPHLDQLYSDCVRLVDYHVDPMCSPTRAALMTGRYSARTGVWSTLTGRYMLHKSECTMADLFAASGYRTALFGKWHLGDNYPYRPQDRGFKSVLSFGGGVIGEIPDYWDNDYFDDTYLRNSRREAFEGYCTDIWFDEAIRFIEADGYNPFLCVISTNAPHGPLNVHDSYSQPYADAGVPHPRDKFYGMIANIDENIGKLQGRLEALGIAEQTIVVFMGDNGTSVGCGLDSRTGFVTDGYNAGMRGKKTWTYEGGHRNSCFIRWPEGGVRGGRDVTGITAHIDIVPTLAELCGISLHDSPPVDGISLASYLRGEAWDRESRQLIVHNQQLDKPVKYRNFSVLEGKWRLVVPGKGQELSGAELYDLSADPGQKSDIAGRFPDVVRHLLDVYEYWWQDVSVRFNEYGEPVVGSEEETVTLLTAHSWHGDVLFDQSHIRAAKQGNGYWTVQVDRAGTYCFELRRWPREVDAPLSAGLPARIGVPYVQDLLQGEALNITHASLEIGHIGFSKPVQQGETSACFTVSLKQGKLRLKTRLLHEEGECGAYYVYIARA
jgi:arylsulfatase A-like enzyme